MSSRADAERAAGRATPSCAWSRSRAHARAAARAGVLALVWACLGLAVRAHAQAPEPWFAQRVEISGAARTRLPTLLELLPRQPPAQYSAAELRELERRIGNLSLFDHVEVQRDGAVLRIKVREKWTLIPEFDLARGTTAADIYVMLGVTEYNAFGLGSALGLSVYRLQRGFGFYTTYQEHVYRRARWSRAVEASYGTSYRRFEGGDAWSNRIAKVWLWSTSTPVISDHLRYEAALLYEHEAVYDAETDFRPPNGHTAGMSMMFTWDTYEWHDLTPHGFSVSLALQPGFFFGPDVPQSRHRADLIVFGAVRLGRSTALVGRLMAAVSSRGNPNYTQVIGSVEGVRGLEDARYFNWAQGFTNLELRHGVRIAPRWALQGVLFADGALFEQLTVQGERGDAGGAFSGGAGVRLVPTWLRTVVLRFDVARVMLPERAFFYQYGLSQYF